MKDVRGSLVIQTTFQAIIYLACLFSVDKIVSLLGTFGTDIGISSIVIYIFYILPLLAVAVAVLNIVSCCTERDTINVYAMRCTYVMMIWWGVLVLASILTSTQTLSFGDICASLLVIIPIELILFSMVLQNRGIANGKTDTTIVPPRRVKVQVLTGEHQGETYDFAKGALTFGTDPSICNVIFHDHVISGKHCRLEYDPNHKKVVIIDTSKNGTFIKKQDEFVKIRSNERIPLEKGTIFALSDKKQQFKID